MKQREKGPDSPGTHSSAADRRQEILLTAAEVFVKKGVDATSIDEVARAMSSTKGLVYHHFRSKNDLLFSVYAKAMEVFFEAIEPLMAVEEPPLPRLERMLYAHGLVLMEHNALQRVSVSSIEARLHLHTTLEERRQIAEIIAMRNRYEQFFRTVISDGMSAGSFRTGDVNLVTRTLLSAINGLAIWYRPRSEDTRKSRMRILDEIIGVLMTGVEIR